MALIETVSFDDNIQQNMKHLTYSDNWPVVYIINDDKEAYIGETVNASVRVSQHLRNDDRKKLTKISLISDDDFNKSVILDLENYLITHMAADCKFILQNSNMGMQPHDYFQKETYEKKFDIIWDQLKARNLVSHTIAEIHNSDMFKFSPYKTLTTDQYRVVDSIIQTLIKNQIHGKQSTIVVNGGGGTGKTVLAIYLMKVIAEANEDILQADNEMNPGYSYIADNLKLLKGMKVGLVVPMQSLRGTIKNVFKNIGGLNIGMVVSPLEVPKDNYDLLIVDEAHRLRQRRALSQYPPFDRNNEKLGLGKEGTELDWIMKCSKHQILFYDSEQSVKPSDVDKDVFKSLQQKVDVYNYYLESQLRCAGGNDYIEYVKRILSDNPPEKKKTFTDYQFVLYENIGSMINEIKKKDSEVGLSRSVAGYSWKWKSKKDRKAYDIEIEGNKYRWNTVNVDWVNSSDSINEIGCIHTIQGYELNYAGIILGNEIKYNAETKEIYIDKSCYYDLPGKTSLKDEKDLKEYILNIYKTMMTRGIRGTFVYACNKELRNYLKQYMKSI